MRTLGDEPSLMMPAMPTAKWRSLGLGYPDRVPSEKSYIEYGRSWANSTRMFPTGIETLDAMLSGGFPDKSVNLIEGPSGIGKEGLCYRFVQASLQRGSVGIYVTRHSAIEVVEDMRGHGVTVRPEPIWLDCSGLEHNVPCLRCSLNDLTGLSVAIKKIIADHSTAKIGLVMDVLSPLLILNSLDMMYQYLNQLFVELKKHDLAALVVIEEAMHTPREIAAIEALFDGVIEIRVYEQGLRLTPLLRVKKMRGLLSQPSYFRFSFLPSGRIELAAYTR